VRQESGGEHHVPRDFARHGNDSDDGKEAMEIHGHEELK
jgi:hypothetical protein